MVLLSVSNFYLLSITEALSINSSINLKNVCVFQPHVLGDIQLLDNEKVMSVARDVTYVCPFMGPIRGVLKVTNYQLHFRPLDAAALQCTLSVPLGVVSILICLILNQREYQYIKRVVFSVDNTFNMLTDSNLSAYSCETDCKIE